jgi:succinate dehydrogenase / fumarate reductase cytochrome b subunit
MMSMDTRNNRPVFLNLLKIRMPIMALVSISHRLTGVLLAVLIPVGIYLFTMSLQSEAGYQQVIHFFQNAFAKILLVALVWALALHLFAGIRFLLIDLDIGVIKPRARQSAWAVQGCAFLCAVWAVGLVL